MSTPARTDAAAPATARRTAGAVGLVLTVAAAVLLLLALTVLNWFGDRTGNPTRAGGSTSRFNDEQDVLAHVKALSAGRVEARFVAMQYFGWAAWVLAVLAVGAALLACLPIAATRAWRLVAVVVAVLGVAATFAAIDLLSVRDPHLPPAPGYGAYLSHAGVAFYTAVAGFVVAAVAALAGNRRRGA